MNGEFTRVELYTDVPKTTDSRKLLLMTPLTYRYIPFSITMNANGHGVRIGRCEYRHLVCGAVFQRPASS